MQLFMHRERKSRVGEKTKLNVVFTADDDVLELTRDLELHSKTSSSAIVGSTIMVKKRRQLSSLENSYLELTEHLVRQYGLSLGVFAKPVKRKLRMVKAISPPPITYQPEHLLTSEQAAAILGLRSKTLANWRVQGVEKLPFRRIGGAVRYQYCDLLTFIEARKHENTSQY